MRIACGNSFGHKTCQSNRRQNDVKTEFSARVYLFVWVFGGREIEKLRPYAMDLCNKKPDLLAQPSKSTARKSVLGRCHARRPAVTKCLRELPGITVRTPKNNKTLPSLMVESALINTETCQFFARKNCCKGQDDQQPCRQFDTHPKALRKKLKSDYMFSRAQRYTSKCVISGV